MWNLTTAVVEDAVVSAITPHKGRTLLTEFPDSLILCSHEIFFGFLTRPTVNAV